MVASSLVAFAVGSVALLFPGWILSSKGVVPSAPTAVWVREVGVLIFAIGLVTFWARKSKEVVAVRAVLLGVATIHLGLLPIELIAYAQGVITKASGVAPNSVLHVVLGLGSLHFAREAVRR